MFEYEGMRRVVYEGGLTFVPVCPICKRFVKADDSVVVNGFEELKDQPNATCSAHGRIKMLFEGWIEG